MNRKPTVSVAVLVRNDPDGLAASLSSARDCVDQLVVRDTGSADNTVEVAHSYDATVVRGSWRRDFGAARNLLLAACNTDWVLMLDADERLVGGRLELGRLLKHPPAAAMSVEIDNAIGFGRRERSRSVRLFRLDSEPRYRYRVHERLEGTQQVATCPLRIEHDGFKGGLRKKKAIRNLALLERDLVDYPDDPYLRWRRARDLEILGRTSESHAELDRTAELLNPWTVTQLRDARFTCSAVADWAAALRARDTLALAVPLATRVVLAEPDRPLARYVHARALVAAGRREDAIRAVRTLLAPGSWRFEDPGEEDILVRRAPLLGTELQPLTAARRASFARLATVV